MNSLNLIVKRFRESRNMTQAELAKMAGVGSGTIGEIESGKRRCTIKTLDKIAKALELTSEEKNRLDNAFMGREIKKDYILEQIKDPIKMMTIPVYESVAAGVGVIPDAQPIDYISIPEMTGECVAIKVKGDSMEPTFDEGDLIVLKKEIEVFVGEIGVFLNKSTGDAVVKRLKKKNGTYLLESDNHIFKDIEFKTDEIVCCGKVVNVVKNNLKNRSNPLLEKLESLDPSQQKIIEMMINGLLEKK